MPTAPPVRDLAGVSATTRAPEEIPSPLRMRLRQLAGPAASPLSTNAEKCFRFRHAPGVGRVLKASLVVCALLALALPGPHARGDEGAGFELEGFWHVTIHYRDEASASPEAERWDDRLWQFERRGSRMQWTEFPTVVFEDPSGRFEARSDGRRVRTLSSWRPNAAQLEQIRAGVAVNPRGARSKGLRGSASEGYHSVGGLRSESAAVIGYSESWSIEGLDALPVFTQDVAMGSLTTEDVQGRTRYRAESLGADGRELRGRYERDGTRHGSFVLRRAGEPFFLGAGKTGTP